MKIELIESVNGGIGVCCREGDLYGDIEFLDTGTIVACTSNGKGEIDAWEADSGKVAESIRRIRDFLQAGESREPEKLNNAQKCKHANWAWSKRGTETSEWCFDCHSWIDSVALAESSLSSPPPTSDLSAPTPPAPLSTQPDTHTEKI